MLGVTEVVDYRYDARAHIIEVARDGAAPENYSYDANGNRLTRTDSIGTMSATYDAQDRVVTYGTSTNTHRPDGTLTARDDGGGADHQSP